MEQYRKFTIENGDGDTIELTNATSKIFLNNPTGLGINNSITTMSFNERMTIMDNSQSFNAIGGEMIFYDYINKDKYEAYNEFITFLTIKPLQLHYQIPTNPAKTFTIDVDVLSIDKTEVKKDGMLRCNFQFQTLSRWKGDKVELEIRGSDIEIVNDGHMPVGFEITIDDYPKLPDNLYYTLSQDNTIYGETKFITTYRASSRPISVDVDKIYVNSIDGEQNMILKYGTAILPNPLSYQDLSISNGTIYVTFIKLARGTSTLTLYQENGRRLIANVNVKFTPLYRSV